MLSGYKTVIFNVIMAIIGIAHALNATADLPGADAVQGAVDQFDVAFTAVYAIGSVILRAISTAPIFNKE